LLLLRRLSLLLLLLLLPPLGATSVLLRLPLVLLFLIGLSLIFLATFLSPAATPLRERNVRRAD
jgi:hypothetical protein